MTKLKAYRIDNRYKLKDIAEAAGVSIQAVQQWETGETKPSLDKLVLVAGFYKCPVDNLIGETDDEGRA